MKLNASAENFLHSLLMPTSKGTDIAVATAGKMDKVEPVQLSGQRSSEFTAMNFASLKGLELAKLTPVQQLGF